MRRTVMTVEMDDPLRDELGLKEAALMALEPLGGRIRVTVVRTVGDEQMSMAGMAPKHSGQPAPVGQAPARPKPRVPTGLGCCLDCTHFRYEPGRDEAGKLLWGVCRFHGRPLRDANKRCNAWAGAEGA